MKFSLSETLKKFFGEHGLLELEGILETEQLAPLGTSLLSTVSGRNSWKKDPSLKKLLHKIEAGKLFSSLVRKTPIRIAYTQVITKKHLAELPEGTPSLEEMSSIFPILGGALLCTRAPTFSKEEEQKLPNLLEQTPGSVIFLSKDAPLPLKELATQENYLGLLVVFGPGSLRYKLSPLDPRTHDLKRIGLAFGDLVPEGEAPSIHR